MTKKDLKNITEYSNKIFLENLKLSVKGKDGYIHVNQLNRLWYKHNGKLEYMLIQFYNTIIKNEDDLKYCYDVNVKSLINTMKNLINEFKNKKERYSFNYKEILKGNYNYFDPWLFRKFDNEISQIQLS